MKSEIVTRELDSAKPVNLNFSRNKRRKTFKLNISRGQKLVETKSVASIISMRVFVRKCFVDDFLLFLSHSIKFIENPDPDINIRQED